MIVTSDRPADKDAEDQAKLDPILFVDDDPDVRSLSAIMLRRGGYAVREASGVKEALEILADPTNKFALVITDVVMPGPDGGALISQLRTLRKGTPVLAVSSFSPYSGDLTFEESARSVRLFSREVMPELSPGQGTDSNARLPASVVDRMGQYGTESDVDIAFPFR